MKKKIALISILLTLAGGVAFAQLVGTQRIIENYWFAGDKCTKFGDYPNASICYMGGNLVVDILNGGGKVSMPDGIDLGTSGMSLASSLVFEGATADAFETTLSVVDPTADRTVSFADDSGTVLLSTAAQSAANSIKGVANGFEFEGATANSFETTLSVTDPTADRAIALPDQGGAIILSVGGVVDTASAISGGTGTFVFEGTTADGFETTVGVVDPTADQTWSVPNFAVSAAFLGSTLTTNAIDAANSFWGISNALVFEGATADGFETTLTVADPGADKTVTIPAATGTVAVGGNTTVSSGANTACNTTCGAGKCLVAQDSDTANIMVACSSATADVCTCIP